MKRGQRVPFVEIDGSPYCDWWSERFAPRPDPLAGMRFYQRGRASIWVGTADVIGLETTRMDAVGIHLLRIGRRMWKPTSAAIRAFASTATINALDLGEEELRTYLEGSDVELGDDDARVESLSFGFIAVRFRGVPVGCGEWHGRGTVASLLPASRRIAELEM